MAKIDIAMTELVWPGKYDEDGTLKEVPRVNHPFQVIETVKESRDPDSSAPRLGEHTEPVSRVPSPPLYRPGT